MSGRVVGLHRIPSRGAPPQRLAEAEVRADWGVVGDRHARPGSSRQVVLVASEVLDELRLAPGATREQLTCSGLGAVGAGDVVVVASARLELVRPRVPCRVMDAVRPGLMAELRGRGGWCARVVAGGTVRPGDEVEVERARPGVGGDPPWLVEYLDALATWEASSAGGPAAPDGWSTFADRLAHLVAWDRHGAEQIGARARGEPAPPPLDVDGFNAAAVRRIRAGGADLWVLHDDATTAVLDLARRHPGAAEGWVRALATHYREHT